MNRILLPLFVFTIGILNAQQPPLKVQFNTLTQVTEDGEFEVEVRVSDFEGLYAVQMFFLWDSTVMKVNEVTEFSTDIPDFDDTMVTLPEQDNARPDKGKLRLSWINPFPLTIDDDTHLMTLSFTSLGMACDSTYIDVGDIGTMQSEIIEVLTIDDTNIGVIGNEFLITIPGPDCLTSTKDAELVNISLYPNPVKDFLHVTMEGGGHLNSEIKLMDLFGNEILRQNLEKNTKVDLTDISAANYFYEILADGVTLQKGKVVKI